MTEGDVREGIRRYLEEHGKRLYMAYMQAIPTMGQMRYRKHVLHAVAASDGEYATMEELVAYTSRALKTSVPATALSGPLRDLKESHGKPLKDVARIDGAGNVRNLTAFRNPMMKFFVRFMGNAEESGLLGGLPSISQYELSQWSGEEEEEEEE